MAINRVNNALTSLRRTVRLYGGPKIKGLWGFSRETAGKDSRFDQYHLYGILPPKHPLAGHRLPAKDLSPAEVRDIVRQAVRLNETSPKLKKPLYGRNGRPPLNPFAAEDEDYPLGDLFSLKTRRDIPFAIIVDRASFSPSEPCLEGYAEEDRTVLERWSKIPEREKEKVLHAFFDKLNENFKYLSGGQFSLRLQGIQFVDQDQGRQPTGGFVMHLLNPNSSNDGIKQYLGNGHFQLRVIRGLFHEKKRVVFTGMAVHEMLHGIFGLGHNDGITEDDGVETGIRTVFDWTYLTRIKFSSFEAEFLGWPKLKSTSTVVDVSLPA